MSSPVNDPNLTYNGRPAPRSSEEEITFIADGLENGEHNPLRLRTSNNSQHYVRSQVSPSHNREQERRLEDDLAMLQAERVASNVQSEFKDGRNDIRRSVSMSLARSKSRRTDPVDDFEIATNPVHEKRAVYRPPENPTTAAAKFLVKIHNSSFLVRYFTYIIPVSALLLIPLLLGALLFKNASIGGVELLWFSVWLEIIWLTLWAGRIVAKMIPGPLGLISSVVTTSSKKWRDMGKELEIPVTLFFWALGVEISFLPTMQNHMVTGYTGDTSWMGTVNRIIVSILVGTGLNLFEKIIIQLVAISFHLRTYADRIEMNNFQIGSLVKLYQYSRDKIAMDDSDFEDQDPSGPVSGARTPMQYVEKAHKNVTEAFQKVGDVAGKVAGDFTGKKVAKSTHPNQVVHVLLKSNAGSQVLARRMYRTFIREDAETVSSDDMKPAFDNEEESDAAFTMFDKDLNGDISMEELESVCVEIGREHKSILASLKDLDSVVSKLDGVMVFIVVCITILFFITIISTSAAGVLTSAGSTVLALSWLFSATAQEFLQSLIFVFVKHPFDVGDRVSIYGNTGSTLKGDDYFVKEISLLFTEFKKMEGHVVQAPNSYLNTLFILNMRRSGGLAEAVPLTVKFGTTLDQIEELRIRLLEFVKVEKREYQPNILTEIRDVVEVFSLNLNVIFFYKSNWQNELLRLQRRNKFICALMISMHEIGIEGPQMRLPGQKENIPFYVHYPAGGIPQRPPGFNDPYGPPLVSPPQEPPQAPITSDSIRYHPSILRGSNSSPRGNRRRGESVSSMAKRVDFSLGMKDISSSDLMGDVHDEGPQQHLPGLARVSASRSRQRATAEDELAGSTGHTSAREDSSARSHLGLQRSSSDTQTAGRSDSAIHRNRFFGRRGREGGRGTLGDEERGMVSISETGNNQRRIDPGSGLINPEAIMAEVGPSHSMENSSHSNQSWQGGTGERALLRGGDFEMSRLRD